MKLWRFLFFALALFVVLFGAYYFLGSHAGGERSSVLSTTAWQRMASPGALSQAHTFLEHNCAACHTAVEGVKASSCVVCHADNKALLQREPSAFHADIGSCAKCHHEHQGQVVSTTTMDHAILARIGLQQMKTASADDPKRTALVNWLRQSDAPSLTSHLQRAESLLNCTGCHSTKDRHFGLFGANCAQCHGTTKWTIPEFRHPSSASQSCVQCHQAPPSHYMMHFKMISAKVAREPSADVTECFKCHQTTAWNDIRGVGWYKHH
jgi:hypothetical protein